MYIPKLIKVGYQERKDTYTGKLAYVIYTDDKGILRKEKSWQGWRDNKINPDDFENEPTEGFVLNRKAGGVGSGWGWHDRVEKVRVYDPRDFEFGISIPNLLFILQECSAIKGKGLEGEFVYAWNGTELVLLPVGCKEYEECFTYTKRQSVQITKEKIVEGHCYLMKDGTEVIYLGRHPFINYRKYENSPSSIKKDHIFFKTEFLEKEPNKYKNPYINESGFTKIGEVCNNDCIHPQYPDAFDKFKKSKWYGECESIKLEKILFSENVLQYNLLLVKEGEDYFPCEFAESYYNYYNYYNKNNFSFKKVEKKFIPILKNNTINFPTIKISNNERYEGKSISELNKLDLYKISLVTKEGNILEVGRW